MELKILIAEDEPRLREVLCDYFLSKGDFPTAAPDGLTALDLASEKEFDGVLLDIMMPGLDGLETTLKIREKYQFPIILLSAKSEDTDKITGLSFGADDYVTKPFSPLELVARVKSQIRRFVSFSGFVKKQSQIVTGGLIIDTAAKTVTVDGREVTLTAKEYMILEYLAQNMDHVLSSSQIYEAVWKEPSFGTEKTVTVHIKNIREKIEIDPKQPQYIKVVYGLGYKCEKVD